MMKGIFVILFFIIFFLGLVNAQESSCFSEGNCVLYLEKPASVIVPAVSFAQPFSMSLNFIDSEKVKLNLNGKDLFEDTPFLKEQEFYTIGNGNVKLKIEKINYYSENSELNNVELGYEILALNRESFCSKEGSCEVYFMGGISAWIDPGVFYEIRAWGLMNSSHVELMVGGTTLLEDSETFLLVENQQITLKDGSFLIIKDIDYDLLKIHNSKVLFDIIPNIDANSYCYSKKEDTRVDNSTKICRFYLGGGDVGLNLNNKIYEIFLEDLSENSFSLNMNGEIVERGSFFENILVTGPINSNQGLLFAEVTFESNFLKRTFYWFRCVFSKSC